MRICICIDLCMLIDMHLGFSGCPYMLKFSFVQALAFTYPHAHVDIFAHICAHANTYVYTFNFIYKHACFFNMCAFRCLHVCVYMRISLHLYTDAQLSASAPMCIQHTYTRTLQQTACTRTSRHAHTHTHTHTYAHTHTHTHTHLTPSVVAVVAVAVAVNVVGAFIVVVVAGVASAAAVAVAVYIVAAVVVMRAVGLV